MRTGIRTEIEIGVTSFEDGGMDKGMQVASGKFKKEKINRFSSLTSRGIVALPKPWFLDFLLSLTLNKCSSVFKPSRYWYFVPQQ